MNIAKLGALWTVKLRPNAHEIINKLLKIIDEIFMTSLFLLSSSKAMTTQVGTLRIVQKNRISILLFFYASNTTSLYPH